MNEFTTTVCQSNGRWEATSSTMVDGSNRELTTRTARNANGVVRTSAIVSRVEGGFKSHAMGFGSSGGDFSATVLSMRHPRATEKAIRLQHETAMAQAESILHLVRQHYAARDSAVEAGHEAVAAAIPANAEVAA
ncbi:hypothetical protein [Pseudorhodoferax sp. Leaf267]|jgi:hypothetical protein|uniref:hypothetical protein n=1 Tax=Pseudorhodoferax sp. Leaf267 TaxID=1736316 RepID=UPI000701E905|nr:hypothetical protein [Pseudorhodoferax sp. Leaf267]KQP14795.1 hypothetical protein ASF43_12060 [Pseudorhodoferax sp. Leaf267]